MSDVINLREFRIRKLKLLMNSSDSSKEIKERLDKLQHSEVAMNRLLADLGLGGKYGVQFYATL